MKTQARAEYDANNAATTTTPPVLPPPLPQPAPTPAVVESNDNSNSVAVIDYCNSSRYSMASHILAKCVLTTYSPTYNFAV